MLIAKYAVLAVGAAMVAAMVYVLFFLGGSRQDIQWRTVAVEVGQPRQVTVTFEVDKPPLSTAECQVAAFDAERNNAGRLTGISVGPSADGARTTRMTVVVLTPVKQAASAAVATCQLSSSG